MQRCITYLFSFLRNLGREHSAHLLAPGKDGCEVPAHSDEERKQLILQGHFPEARLGQPRCRTEIRTVFIFKSNLEAGAIQLVVD